MEVEREVSTLRNFCIGAKVLEILGLRLMSKRSVERFVVLRNHGEKPADVTIFFHLIPIDALLLSSPFFGTLCTISGERSMLFAF